MSRILLLGLAVLVAVLPSTIGMAQQQRHEIVVTPQSAVQAKQTLSLPINKSEVFEVNQAISKIAIGNAEIADAVAVGEHSFYVYGKKSGSTNLSVYSRDAKLLAVIDIIVGADVDAVKKALYDAFPQEKIAVSSVNDTIMLSGALNSPAKASHAVEIAKQFIDKDKSVINNLKITGTQQVMLQVKVSLIERTLAQSLGFKPFVSAGAPSSSTSTKPGLSVSTLDPVNTANFLLASGTAISGHFAFTEMVDALETKGAVKVLAEPNLVAMSGDTASFLVGGEFPIPVVQSTSGTTTAPAFPTITIEFKQFGISLAFTPTVIDTDLINLVVAPEVSQLDETNAITLDGFVIPGIATRRAKTTVELRDGQSFAIAGLLSSDFNDTLRGIPALMDIPVFGALFRGSNYTRDETELVIIVTPHLVQPVPARTLIAPTDSFVPPSDEEFFL
ncbi:MAG: type II and III secretion system protein family protein, partial [Alphaproteobacteria bacterium]